MTKCVNFSKLMPLLLLLLELLQMLTLTESHCVRECVSRSRLFRRRHPPRKQTGKGVLFPSREFLSCKTEPRCGRSSTVFEAGAARGVGDDGGLRWWWVLSPSEQKRLQELARNMHETSEARRSPGAQSKQRQHETNRPEVVGVGARGETMKSQLASIDPSDSRRSYPGAD